MSEGVSDMHCMSDDYLVQELADEQAEKEELKANGHRQISRRKSAD